MTPRDLSHSQLLAACLESDSADAWTEFVRRYQPAAASALWGTLRRWHIGSAAGREIIDDLVQQTFLRICAMDRKALREMRQRHENSVPAYIRVVATNVAIDYLRQRDVRQESLDDTDPPPVPSSADSEILMDEIDRHLEHCGGADHGRVRTVFWLYYRVGLTANSIARMPQWNLTEKGVESLLLRTIRCLRRLIVEGKSPAKQSREGGSARGASG